MAADSVAVGEGFSSCVEWILTESATVIAGIERFDLVDKPEVLP